MSSVILSCPCKMHTIIIVTRTASVIPLFHHILLTVCVHISVFSIPQHLLHAMPLYLIVLSTIQDTNRHIQKKLYIIMLYINKKEYIVQLNAVYADEHIYHAVNCGNQRRYLNYNKCSSKYIAKPKDNNALTNACDSVLPDHSHSPRISIRNVIFVSLNRCVHTMLYFY